MGIKPGLGHLLSALCRAAPAMLGPRRVFERLRWRLGMAAYRLIGDVPPDASGRVVQARNGARMELALNEFVDRSIYCTGEWEPRETELIRRRLRPGDCMVDVGSYIGWFTLLGARLVGPAGRVIAFEANPATYARLQRNLSLNGLTQVEPHNRAVGDQPGRVRIGSRTPGNAGGDFVDFSQSDAADGVEVVLLDDVLRDQSVRVLKIDIEGAEAKALRGARELLARADAPDLVLELTPAYIRAAGDDPAELVELLRSSGYRLLEIGQFALALPQGDLAKREQTYLYCTKDLELG